MPVLLAGKTTEDFEVRASVARVVGGLLGVRDGEDIRFALLSGSEGGVEGEECCVDRPRQWRGRDERDLGLVREMSIAKRLTLLFSPGCQARVR